MTNNVETNNVEFHTSYDSDSHGPTEQLARDRGERLVMTSVRLDRTLHQTLRQIAFDRRKSLHSLLIEGARAVCQRYQKEGVVPGQAAE